MRVVAHTELGADRQTLIKLYRTLLCSQLDYGIFVYRSARKSYLKQLDPIHHGSLRLVLGAFRTSPIDSLYTEAHEAPLQIRSEKLALQYYTKLNLLPLTQHMTAPLIRNTDNISTKKKNQLDHLASVWSLFSKKPPFL